MVCSDLPERICGLCLVVFNGIHIYSARATLFHLGGIMSHPAKKSPLFSGGAVVFALCAVWQLIVGISNGGGSPSDFSRMLF